MNSLLALFVVSSFPAAPITLAGRLALNFFLALTAALVLTPVARLLARRAGAIDMPEARRIHSVPTPRWGGLAVFAAELISLIIAAAVLKPSRDDLAAWGWLVPATAAGAALLLILGMLDDRKSVSPYVKLAAEVAVAALVVLSGCRVRALLGIALGGLSIPVTVVWIVAVINAFNMVDGLDGLAAGLALMISLTLSVLSVQAPDIGAALIVASLGGAALGFLCYNFNPATIFLGDSGSMPIGLLLAVVSAHSSGKGSTAATIVVPILALGLPLAELSVTTLRRLLRAVNVVRSVPANGEYRFSLAGKAALFSADRDHIHHRLLALGLTQREATLLMYAVCVVVNAGALALLWKGRSYEGLLPFAAAAGLIVCVRTLGYRELQLVRNGLLLPLFPVRLLELRSLQIPADFVFSCLSLIVAYRIHLSPEQGWPGWTLLVQVAVLQTGFLALGGLYGRSQPLASLQGALVIARSIFYVSLATVFVSAMIGDSPFRSSETMIIDLYLFATLIVGYRVSFHLLDHIFNNSGRIFRRVLIYGTGEAATAALHTILSSPSLRMTVVGFIDEGSANRTHQGLPVLGSEAFNGTAREFDDIILPSSIPEKTLKKLSMRCQLAKLPLKRLSVDCTEVDAPAELREISDLVRGAS